MSGMNGPELYKWDFSPFPGLQITPPFLASSAKVVGLIPNLLSAWAHVPTRCYGSNVTST